MSFNHVRSSSTPFRTKDPWAQATDAKTNNEFLNPWRTGMRNVQNHQYQTESNPWNVMDPFATVRNDLFIGRRTFDVDSVPQNEWSTRGYTTSTSGNLLESLWSEYPPFSMSESVRTSVASTTCSDTRCPSPISPVGTQQPTVTDLNPYGLTPDSSVLIHALMLLNSNLWFSDFCPETPVSPTEPHAALHFKPQSVNQLSSLDEYGSSSLMHNPNHMMMNSHLEDEDRDLEKLTEMFKDFKLKPIQIQSRYSMSGSRNKRNKYKLKKPICVDCAFCKNNGENESVFKSHILKDPEGRVLCPVLRMYRCPICKNEGGDEAHTITYCPKRRSEHAAGLRHAVSTRDVQVS